VPHLDLRLIYILISRTYSKFARENSFPALRALEVCFPQPCSSSGRRFAVSRSHVQSYRRIVSFPQKKFDEMRCKLDSIENLRSSEKIRRNTQPHLMVGLNDVSQRTRISWAHFNGALQILIFQGRYVQSDRNVWLLQI
jgi:hypothetical protein